MYGQRKLTPYKNFFVNKCCLFGKSLCNPNTTQRGQQETPLGTFCSNMLTLTPFLMSLLVILALLKGKLNLTLSKVVASIAVVGSPLPAGGVIMALATLPRLYYKKPGRWNCNIELCTL